MAQLEVHKLATLTGHRDSIYALAPGPEANLFFSAGADGMVALWDLENPENGELIAKVPNSIYSLAFIKDQNQLLVGQNFQGIHLIDIKSKKEVNSSKITESYIFDIKITKQHIFVATGDGYLIILSREDLSTLSKLKLSEKSARAIAYNPEDEILAIGFSDYSYKIFSLKKNKVIYEVNAHQNSIFTVVFSPDYQYLLTGSRDAHLKIWNCKEGFEPQKGIVAHMYAINHIEYSPDQSWFATCSMDKSLKIWDAKTFKLLKVIDKARHAGHGTSINKLLWTEHNNLLVSCSDDRTISVWDIQNQL